jgi:hypothetical protein
MFVTVSAKMLLLVYNFEDFGPITLYVLKLHSFDNHVQK